MRANHSLKVKSEAVKSFYDKFLQYFLKQGRQLWTKQKMPG
jgi:hypothetical protein